VKAVVIDRPHEVAYRDVAEPVYGPGDVVVRSHKAGVCRTDLEVLEGALDPRWVRYPCIPGHEWSGSVAEVGGEVIDLEPGDRVVCEGIIPCNRCRPCKAGATNLCVNYESLGFTRGGGWGELVVAPRHVVHRLSDSVSFEAAVLVEPASVVLRGLERGRLTVGESIGVIGIGTIGSLVILLGRIFSPREIVAFGIRDEELELASRLGADRVVNITRSEPEGGFDIVIETAGAVAALELATRLPREGGRILQLGLAGAGKELVVPADRLVLRDLELIASIGYTSAVWARLLELVRAGLVELDQLVTHQFAASEFRTAFELMDRREGIVGKVVLEHEPR
jgi:2-desacetyl-2-hydroxyethyl bacteriochlorophyllide A dehydrogenase